MPTSAVHTHPAAVNSSTADEEGSGLSPEPVSLLFRPVRQYDQGTSHRGIVGGEIQEYTKLMAESREQAINRMIALALQRGANAVLNVAFSTSS